MADMQDIPAWILLFLGIYSIAASLGELLRPGNWGEMLDEMERSAALRIFAGIVIFFMGAVIYLSSPWRPDDWMAVLVTVLSGWAAIEGVLFIAVGDRLIAFSKRMIGDAWRGWAWFALALGVAAVLAALGRL